MTDGGFCPAFNAPPAAHAPTQLIAPVAITNSGRDMGQMSPMHQDIQRRYATMSDHWLSDSGFPKLRAIDEVTNRGTQTVLSPPNIRNAEIDPREPSRAYARTQVQQRASMASDFAKAPHIQRIRRSAAAECPNAQLQRGGLIRSSDCGLVKARAERLWHALAHNFMPMRSPGIAFAV